VCMFEVSLPTCTRHGHRQHPEIVLTQFVSPDNEHDVLETCRQLKIYIEKNCGSRWSFNKNDGKFVESPTTQMHFFSRCSHLFKVELTLLTSY
jgi:hypothetical protein